MNDSLNTDIEAKIKQIIKHKMNEEKQALAQRHIAAIQDAIERLTEVRVRLDRQFRLQLEQQVQRYSLKFRLLPIYLN